MKNKELVRLTKAEQVLDQDLVTKGKTSTNGNSTTL